MTDMSRGPVLATIVRFGLPLGVAGLTQQGYLLVDSIVVGRYLGSGGLAAIGASQPLFTLLGAVFTGVATAFSVRLAQDRGAGLDLRPAAVTALAVFTAGWSAACLGLAVLLAGPVLTLMGVGGQVADDSRRFLVVLSAGLVFVFGLGAVAAVLRGRGHARSPMYLMIFASVLNALLAWLLVGPFGMGLPGAALATGAANAVALAVGVAHLRRATTGATRQRSGDRATTDPVPRPSDSPATPGPAHRPAGGDAVRYELLAALRTGLPLAVQHLMIGLGVLVLVWIVAPFGTAALGALTVVARLELFTGLVFLSLSGALMTFVAQNRGAGRDDRVAAGLRRTLGLTLALTVLVCAVLLGQRGAVAALFADDGATRAVIERYIVITFPFFALYTVMVVAHGWFTGLGRTVVPLVCTVLSFVLVRLPLSYLLGHGYGVDGIMWAIVIGWAVGFGYTALAARRPAFRVRAADAPRVPV